MRLWTMQIYPDTDILKQFIKSSKYIYIYIFFFFLKIAQMRHEELEVIFLHQIFFPY